MNLRPAFGAAIFAIVLTTHLQAQYLTGFESPPFTSGTINGQDSWTTQSPVDAARIRTAGEVATDLENAGFTAGQTVHSGSQALAISGAGAGAATIRVIPGLASETRVTLDVWARPLPLFNGATNQGNVFMTMEDNLGNRAAAFRFGPSNSIDYGTNVGGIWQTSSMFWDTDTWYRLTLAVDYAAKTYDFAINGTQVNTTPIPFYSPNANGVAANLSQIRIFRGQNQAGMLVDDLVVIPEPGTLGCLLFGAYAIGMRRRREHNGG